LQVVVVVIPPEEISESESEHFPFLISIVVVTSDEPEIFEEVTQSHVFPQDIMLNTKSPKTNNDKIDFFMF